MPKADSTKRLPLKNLLLNIRAGSARLRLENGFISHVLRGKVSSPMIKYMGLSSLGRGPLWEILQYQLRWLLSILTG